MSILYFLSITLLISSSYSSSNKCIREQSSHGCHSSSGLDNDNRVKLIQEIQESILHRLGLSQVPNVTQKDIDSLPPLYTILRDENVELTQLDIDSSKEVKKNFRLRYKAKEDPDEFQDYSVNSEKLISLSQSPPPNIIGNISVDNPIHYFDILSPKLINSDLSHAHLWIHIKNHEINAKKFESSLRSNSQERKNGQMKAVWVVLYKVITRRKQTKKKLQQLYSSFTPSLLTLRHIRTRKVHIPKDPSSGPTWVKLNIKSLVSDWISRPQENLGIVIRCYDRWGRDITIRHPRDRMAEDAQLQVRILVFIVILIFFSG